MQPLGVPVGTTISHPSPSRLVLVLITLVLCILHIMEGHHVGIFTPCKEKNHLENEKKD